MMVRKSDYPEAWTQSLRSKYMPQGHSRGCPPKGSRSPAMYEEFSSQENLASSDLEPSVEVRRRFSGQYSRRSECTSASKADDKFSNHGGPNSEARICCTKIISEEGILRRISFYTKRSSHSRRFISPLSKSFESSHSLIAGLRDSTRSAAKLDDSFLKHRDFSQADTSPDWSSSGASTPDSGLSSSGGSRTSHWAGGADDVILESDRRQRMAIDAAAALSISVAKLDGNLKRRAQSKCTGDVTNYTKTSIDGLSRHIWSSHNSETSTPILSGSSASSVSSERSFSSRSVSDDGFLSGDQLKSENSRDLISNVLEAEHKKELFTSTYSRSFETPFKPVVTGHDDAEEEAENLLEYESTELLDDLRETIGVDLKHSRNSVSTVVGLRLRHNYFRSFGPSYHNSRTASPAMSSSPARSSTSSPTSSGCDADKLNLEPPSSSGAEKAEKPRTRHMLSSSFKAPLNSHDVHAESGHVVGYRNMEPLKREESNGIHLSISGDSLATSLDDLLRTKYRNMEPLKREESNGLHWSISEDSLATSLDDLLRTDRKVDGTALERGHSKKWRRDSKGHMFDLEPMTEKLKYRSSSRRKNAPKHGEHNLIKTFLNICNLRRGLRSMMAVDSMMNGGLSDSYY